MQSKNNKTDVYDGSCTFKFEGRKLFRKFSTEPRLKIGERINRFVLYRERVVKYLDGVKRSK